ncbi:MAG: hypothetical protein BYD32DRAFT_433083 [Podila humilis]|nr:MAG: hypothetical protein BYD32DRAFT_433083 [Podila humilis]
MRAPRDGVSSTGEHVRQLLSQSVSRGLSPGLCHLIGSDFLGSPPWLLLEQLLVILEGSALEDSAAVEAVCLVLLHAATKYFQQFFKEIYLLEDVAVAQCLSRTSTARLAYRILSAVTCSMVGYTPIIFLLLAKYSASGLMGQVETWRFSEISTFLGPDFGVSAVVLREVFGAVVFEAVAFLVALC